MTPNRREQIARALRSLAEYHATTMAHLEQAMNLLCEEFALDPLTYLQRRPAPGVSRSRAHKVSIDPSLLSVTFQGKSCFLGNTLPFKFLTSLSRRPNTYVAYDELLSEVWQCVVSDSAVRAVAKNLRRMLRQGGLATLADAVDGSVHGHYALTLPL